MCNFNSTHKILFSNKRGFTLIEILFVFFILAVITYQISLAMIGAYRTRDNLQKMGNFYTELRLSLGILERDIRLSYSPLSARARPEIQLKEEDRVLLNGVFRGAEQEKSDFWLPVVDLTGIRPARFIGDEKSLSFITTSHFRVYQNSMESIFLKVKYELREDPSPEAREAKLFALYRIVDTNAFSMNDDRSETQKVYPLLTRIKGLNFSYYNQRNEIYNKSWDNENSEFRLRYPDIIRLQLTVVSLQNKEYMGVYEFKPEQIIGSLPDTF